MKNTLISLLFLTVTFMFNGCAAQNQVIIDNKFPSYVAIDPTVADDFIFISKTDGVSASGNKKVLIEMENKTNYKQTVMYKIEWKNNQGFVEKTIMSRWIMVDVEPQRRFQMTSTAPTKYSDNYNVRILKPNSSDYKRKNSYQSEYTDR
ncbi:MAG: DUF1425 domain-containing protein [Campylobacterota bacterium]|nr:DUF1425 domain-containing protein [Campylobacterota bacterium]